MTTSIAKKTEGMTSMQSFGAWLRGQRKARDLTQRELADLVGCSTIMVRQLEAHRRRPSKAVLQRLLTILQVPDEQRGRLCALARADLSVATCPSTDVPIAHSGARMPPLPLTGLIGREQDVCAVVALLRQPGVRLLSLTGAAGVGKTRLSLHLAHELRADFRDGVVLVELAALSSASEVPAQILNALALAAHARAAPLDAVTAYLRPRQLLLILDNYEHVLEAAPLISALLAAAPETKALVTSRERLSVYGEHEYSIAALALPQRRAGYGWLAPHESPAVQLFLERVRAAKPQLALAPADEQRIAQLCCDLDGLPLALELVAGQVRFRSLAMIQAQLAQLLPNLSHPLRDGQARHQSVWSALDWSYQTLSADLRHLLQSVSIFRGDWTAAAAAAVSGLPVEAAVLEARLLLLVQKHLIRQTLQPDGSARFDMLFVVREYSQAQLVAQGQAAAVRERHAAYQVGLAEQIKELSCGSRRREAVSLLQRAQGDMLAALQWLSETNASAAVQLIEYLGLLWLHYGYRATIWPTIAMLQAQRQRLPIRARAMLSHWFALCTPNLAEGEQWLIEGLALYRQLDDWHGYASALNDLGGWAYNYGRYAEATQRWLTCLQLMRGLGPDTDVPKILNNLGAALAAQGAYGQARVYFSEVASSPLLIEQPERRIILLNNLGQMHLLCQQLPDAETTLQQARWIAQRHHEPRLLAHTLFLQGYSALSCGDVRRALDDARQSLVILYDLQLENEAAPALELCAVLAVVLGQTVAATQLLGAAQHVRRMYQLPVTAIDRQRHELLSRPLQAHGLSNDWLRLPEPCPDLIGAQIVELVQCLAETVSG